MHDSGLSFVMTVVCDHLAHPSAMSCVVTCFALFNLIMCGPPISEVLLDMSICSIVITMLSDPSRFAVVASLWGN